MEQWRMSCVLCGALLDFIWALQLQLIDCLRKYEFIVLVHLSHYDHKS